MVDNRIFIALAVYGIQATPPESPEVRLPTLLRSSRRFQTNMPPIVETDDENDKKVGLGPKDKSLVETPKVETFRLIPPAIEIEDPKDTALSDEEKEILLTNEEEKTLDNLAKEMMRTFYNQEQNITPKALKGFFSFWANPDSVPGEVKKTLENKLERSPGSNENMKSLMEELKQISPIKSNLVFENLLDNLHKKCRVSP